MNLTCKACGDKSRNVEDFVTHFELNHKVSANSRFCCGLDSCFVLSSSREKFRKHLLEFHPVQLTNDDGSQAAVFPPIKTYNCNFPDCSFSCSVSSTLRSHRKRKHGNFSENAEGIVAKVFHTDCELDNALDSEPSRLCPMSSVENVEATPQVPAPSLAARRNQVKEKFNQFYLSLSSQYHIPEATIQFMVNTHHELGKESNNILSKELVDGVSKCLVDDPSNFSKLENTIATMVSNNVVAEIHDPQGNLRSMYMRRKTYHESHRYVSPKSFKLGLNECNEMKKGHFVPIEETLIELFEDDSIYEQYCQSKLVNSEDDMIRDIHDGSLVKTHPVLSQDRSAIGIMLYQDDLEIANPLGSAKGKHKITCVYYTLSNLKPWTRNQIKVIRLGLIVAEKDVAYFGLEKSLKPLLRQLQNLVKDGIVIRGEQVKVVPIMLLGDNLGTHTLIGLVESFSLSKYFCRYCEESREEWRQRWRGSEDEEFSDSETESSDSESDSDDSADGVVENIDEANYNWDEDIFEQEDIHSHSSSSLPFSCAPVRTASSYDSCVSRLEKCKSLVSVKGVVANCLLNGIGSFHCIGSSPPCIAHDLFEGVIAYDVALAVKYFISTTDLTVDSINRKIRSLKMLGSDRGDKPAFVTVTMKKLRGNAVQNWNFLRFLPLIIGSHIKKGNPKWQMILKLIEVTRTLTSPAISKSYLPALKKDIYLYLDLRVSCFPLVPLRPKHHFMEHYAELIEVFGCLMRVGTLGFESKHRFFKSTAAAKKNFKNITLTLSEEHQLANSAHSIEHLSTSFPILESASPFNLVSISPGLKECMVAYFGEDYLKASAFSTSVRFRGTLYLKGEAVVTKSSTNVSAQLCLAELILVNGKNCYICGQCCQADIKPHLQVFAVTRMSKFMVVNVERIPDYISYPLYKMYHHDIVLLKHLIVSSN